MSYTGPPEQEEAMHSLNELLAFPKMLERIPQVASRRGMVFSASLFLGFGSLWTCDFGLF
jgi:hypothetical protein